MIVFDLPDGQKIVSMIIFRERLLVATTSHVYEYDGGMFKPLPFSIIEEPGYDAMTFVKCDCGRLVSRGHTCPCGRVMPEEPKK